LFLDIRRDNNQNKKISKNLNFQKMSRVTQRNELCLFKILEIIDQETLIWIQWEIIHWPKCFRKISLRQPKIWTENFGTLGSKSVRVWTQDKESLPRRLQNQRKIQKRPHLPWKLMKNDRPTPSEILSGYIC
jgi:hypothetical protein